MYNVAILTFRRPTSGSSLRRESCSTGVDTAGSTTGTGTTGSGGVEVAREAGVTRLRRGLRRELPSS